MKLKAQGARAADVDEVRALLHETFLDRNWEPGALAPFYRAYEICDPDYRPAQYRFLRLRGRVVSALGVFVRHLHHPRGPVPVTIIGGVCTRERLRGRGLIEPVIEDSLRYSRRLGASAMLIVTPRPNYYLRHGFVYFATCAFEGAIPHVPPGRARIEPLTPDDAAWMTEMYNAHPERYGPIVRAERYVAKWVLEMRLAQLSTIGLKHVARGRPTAYTIATVGKEEIAVQESVGGPRSGAAQARLLSSFLLTGRTRFECPFPAEHALVRYLCDSGANLKLRRTERFMYRALKNNFPVPGEEFFYSLVDFV